MRQRGVNPLAVRVQFIQDPRFFSPHDQIAAVIKLEHLPSDPARHQSDETPIRISL
jgi:hypothetical protein